MIEPERIIVQLAVHFDGKEYNTHIQGLNGHFDIDHMRVLLGERTAPYFGDIHKEIEKKFGKEEESFYSVYAEVKRQESETQYGTGYGDVLTLPGYYYIGNALSIIKHVPD